MNWDLIIGLLGTAASLSGLLWNKENAKKIAFVFLALLAFTLIGKGVLYQTDVGRVQARIIDALDKSKMSSDELYEVVSSEKITRTLFNDALNNAVEVGRIEFLTLELRTSEGSYMRVRAYFIPAS